MPDISERVFIIVGWLFFVFCLFCLFAMTNVIGPGAIMFLAAAVWIYLLLKKHYFTSMKSYKIFGWLLFLYVFLPLIKSINHAFYFLYALNDIYEAKAGLGSAILFAVFILWLLIALINLNRTHKIEQKIDS